MDRLENRAKRLCEREEAEWKVLSRKRKLWINKIQQERETLVENV